MSAADLAMHLATVATAVVIVIGGLWAVVRYVFLAPLRASIDALSGRVDTAIGLLSTHRHSETGTVIAPIAGGGNNEPRR